MTICGEGKDFESKLGQGVPRADRFLMELWAFTYNW